MRFTTIAALALIVGVAVGQGNKPTKELRENGIASAGYIQDDFGTNLSQHLVEALSRERAAALMAWLGQRDLSDRDVLRILGGTCTNRDLSEHFGAKRRELKSVRAAIGKAVDDKNKSAFFGIMIDVMIANHDLDPTGAWFQQVCGAHDAISDKALKTILKGSRSGNAIEEAFGFEHNDDQKLVREIIRGMVTGDMVHHPMLRSMGMGKAEKYSRRRFARKMTKHMAGFGKFADGRAGRMPLDKDLPPVPYYGKDMAENFGK